MTLWQLEDQCSVRKLCSSDGVYFLPSSSTSYACFGTKSSPEAVWDQVTGPGLICKIRNIGLKHLVICLHLGSYRLCATCSGLKMRPITSCLQVDIIYYVYNMQLTAVAWDQCLWYHPLHTHQDSSHYWILWLVGPHLETYKPILLQSWQHSSVSVSHRSLQQTLFRTTGKKTQNLSSYMKTIFRLWSWLRVPAAAFQSSALRFVFQSQHVTRAQHMMTLAIGAECIHHMCWSMTNRAIGWCWTWYARKEQIKWTRHPFVKERSGYWVGV